MPVWQESQDLAVTIYRITEKLPKSEMYALTDQMRRSSSSISANIAEGFGRGTYKDRSHFYHIALGSLLETKNFIYLSARLRYIPEEDVNKIIKDIESVHSQITAILRYLHHHE